MHGGKKLHMSGAGRALGVVARNKVEKIHKELGLPGWEDSDLRFRH